MFRLTLLLLKIDPFRFGILGIEADLSGWFLLLVQRRDLLDQKLLEVRILHGLRMIVKI